MKTCILSDVFNLLLQGSYHRFCLFSALCQTLQHRCRCHSKIKKKKPYWTCWNVSGYKSKINMNAILCIIEQQLLHKIRKLQFYNIIYIIYDKLSYTVYSECNYTCSNTRLLCLPAGWRKFGVTRLKRSKNPD